MSVKGPWCNWSRLNGPLKHGKGGVTRCPAMMSSIGALCGSQACHSFIPPGVCCWSHPSTKAIAKTWLVGPCTQTWKSTPPPPPRPPHPVMAMLQLLQILSHNTHSHSHPYPVVGTHPLKNPHTIHFISTVHSPLPLTCFYKVKHSQVEGKNTWSS